MPAPRRRRGPYVRTQSYPPEMAFRHAARLLNDTNVDALWKLSCRLSLHDAYTEPGEPIFIMPTLNPEKIRLFDQAVITSTASHTRTQGLSEDDLRNVLDDCTDAQYDPQALVPLQQVDGTDRVHLEFYRFMAQSANVQFPQQEPRSEVRAGRVIAMFDVLPREHRDLITSAQLKDVDAVLARMEELLQVPLSVLGECYFATLAYQSYAFTASSNCLDGFLAHIPPFASDEERHGTIISGLLRYEPQEALDRWLMFSPARLGGFFAVDRSSEFIRNYEAFLSLFSATTDDLRVELRTQPEFSIGHLSSRLSPLERYPVVRLNTQPGAANLIVPNLRHLAKSFGHRIDSLLLKRMGEQYNQARGALQELYLRKLIEDRLPHLLVIPEMTYTYGKQELKGPDLTLINEEQGRIILIESKGRRMTLATRLTMEPAIFNKNLEDAYDALRGPKRTTGLPQKLFDLYAGRPEYSTYQAAIESTRGSEPIFVVVLSEGVYFMSHLLREQARMYPDDPLHGFEYCFCVLSLDTFERAVEIARAHQLHLHEPLEQHWRRSGERNYQDHHADAFGGLAIEDGETFAARFAPSWPELVRA